MFIPPIGYNSPVFCSNDKYNEDKKKESRISRNERALGKKPKINIYSMQANPAFMLQTKLLQDGFTVENMKEWGLFQTSDLKDGVDITLLAENVDLIQETGITPDDIFKRTPKTMEDVTAMSRIYKLLKEKYITDDVVKYHVEMLEIQKEMDKFFGKNTPEDSTVRNLFLRILHNTNRFNESVTRELLDDKTFNNVSLPEALMSVSDKESEQCALKVIKMAQEKGYKKEFSIALSVLISEATPFNLPAIEKMLDEQDFLIDDDEFVCNKLMTFVRTPNPLLALYIKDDSVDLRVIDEIMQFEDDDEDSEE